MGRCTGGNKALSDFVIIDEGPEDEPNWRIDEMSARLTAMIALLAGVLMILSIASIACETAPASPAPTSANPTQASPITTPADPTPANPITTPAVPTPASPSPTPADPATPAPDRQTDASGDPDALKQAQAELDKHRALWAASRAGDYSFVLAPMCFCPQDLLDPVRITVVNGVVASVTYVESGKAPEHDGFGRYVTIDDLFDTIQEAIDRKASQITVTYDPETGYPTDARLDYVARMTDEEYMFTVSDYSSGEHAAATDRVTGTITYRERMALGPDATVEVELRDVSLQDAPSITIAKVTITGPGQVPVSFEIEYDPSSIDDRATYAVRATINDRGQMLFTNTTTYDVITRGNPTHVDMVLERVGAVSPTPAPEMTSIPAPIESVVVTGDHTGYSLSIVSGLPSGCARFDGYHVEHRGKVLEVTVTNLMPTGPVACTAIYDRHEGEVDLGADFETAVTYTVVVNGQVTNAFVARDPKWFLASVVESPIRMVDVNVLESSPPQYQVSVVSTLPLGSSCSTFNGYDIDRRGGNEIHVTVTHLEVLQKNMPCTRDLPAVTTQIALGSDFTPGEEYTVIVNGETKTFTAR